MKYPLTRYMKSIIYSVKEFQQKVIDHVTENFTNYRDIFRHWFNEFGHPDKDHSMNYSGFRYDIPTDENMFAGQKYKENERLEKMWYNNLRFYWKKRNL